MPYKVRQNGRNYEVVLADTEEVKSVHKPPDARKKAEAQVRLLEEREGFDHPDKVKYLDDGTKVNIKYKNKESYSGSDK